MKRLAINIAKIITIVFLGLVAFGVYYIYGNPVYTWNQKLTVEVEVDGEVYSGSSVITMTVEVLPDLGGSAARRFKTQGEATVVELPDGKYLFALLSYTPLFAGKVFEEDMDGSMSESGERWAEIITQLRKTKILKPNQYPSLVTFTDIDDPKSVKKVNPDDLAASFGAGYKLKSITLKITDELVTKGVLEKVLVAWLSKRFGQNNSVISLKLPNDSPRGWVHLGPLRFWSLDRLQEMDRRYK